MKTAYNIAALFSSAAGYVQLESKFVPELLVTVQFRDGWVNRHRMINIIKNFKTLS